MLREWNLYYWKLHTELDISIDSVSKEYEKVSEYFTSSRI